ncbi:hypothetical protein QOK74_08390 [Staphylococcus saprophyticus]|uniref:hypothetical protein n=1 Tax=Staphylococcus saprophyticus TaxID=29385 RepID=UPI0024C42222|nr:hypothetical protein [Staphylococcus saprophyticus]MDK1672890.1 hypothetical protein [Staphylococcus saprophyticus]
MKKLLSNLVLLILFIRSIYILVEWFNGNSNQSFLIIPIYLVITAGVVILFVYEGVKLITGKRKNSKQNDV